MLKQKIKNENNRYKFFVSIVLVFSLLCTIFSVTFAYLSGTFDSSDVDMQSPTPFLNTKFYSNSSGTSEISNVITGSVTSSGVTIGSTTSTTSLNCPVYIKNTGNVNGVLYADLGYLPIYVEISFYNDSGRTDLIEDAEINYNDSGDFYIALTNASDPQIEFNCMYQSSNDYTLTKDGGNSLQILNSLTIDSSITSSNLVGKYFSISFIVDLVQEDLPSNS